MDFGSINEVRKGRLLKLCDIDQSYRLYLIFPGILKRKFYELTEGLCNVRKGCYDRGNNGKFKSYSFLTSTHLVFGPPSQTL